MALLSTGYQVAAVTVGFTGATRKIDSLADNEWTDLSDEIDNSTNLYTMADFELVLGSAAFTGADSAVLMYIVPCVDGTNYPDWTGDGIADLQEQEQYFAGSFTTSGTTAAQRLALERIPLPPGKFKIGMRSRANVALAASGNTLKYRPHSFKDA